MKTNSISPILALALICSMLLSSPVFAASTYVVNGVKAATPIDLSNNSDNQNASALEREATNLTQLVARGAFRQVSTSDRKEAKQTAKILAQTDKNPILLTEES